MISKMTVIVERDLRKPCGQGDRMDEMWWYKLSVTSVVFGTWVLLPFLNKAIMNNFFRIIYIHMYILNNAVIGVDFDNAIFLQSGPELKKCKKFKGAVSVSI